MSLGLNCTASHVNVLRGTRWGCKEASRQKIKYPFNIRRRITKIRFTFAGVAFVIMGTFCSDDSFVFSFQDCGTFYLTVFCATPMDTVSSWVFLVIWVAVVKCNFFASVWFYNLNLHFGTSDRCCYWNTEWLEIFTQFRLQLGANCVIFLLSVC